MAMDGWVSAGKIGIVNRGAFDIEKQYKVNDVVKYGVAVYCALKDTKGHLPTEEEYWIEWTRSAQVDIDDEMSDTSVNPVENKIVKGYIDERTVVDSALSDTSTNPVQNKVIKEALDNASIPVATTTAAGKVKPDGETITVDEDGTIHGAITIDIDAEMSSTSENPVQNKIIKEYIDIHSGSMIKLSRSEYNAKIASGEITSSDLKYYDVYEDDAAATGIEASMVTFKDSNVFNALETKQNKPEEEIVTLYSNRWHGQEAPYTYNLGIDDEYDFETILPSDATYAEIDTITRAGIVSSNDNIVRAWGDKPTGNFRLVLRKVVR